MTLEEFKQKIETVSDRRLMRMLERAQMQNLREAITLVENERLKRAAAAAVSSASESGSFEELTSQIRPLEEVLGRHFVKGEALAKSETLASTPREREAEEMDPLVLTASDWSQFASPASPTSPASPASPFAALSAASPSAASAAANELKPITSQIFVGQSFAGHALVEPALARSDSSDEDQDHKAEPQPIRRGLVIFAIILLLLAGFFAFWRALVG
jgi:hypothetical protein